MTRKRRLKIILAAAIALAASAAAAGFLEYQQHALAESALSAQQLNIQVLDRISRLRLVELDLRRNVDRGTRIYAKNEDHPPFAGEEIAITMQWYEAFVRPERFASLPESLQTVVHDMAQPLAELDASFEKLRALDIRDRAGRVNVLETEISREVSALISLCESFITQNSQALAANTSLLRERSGLMRILTALQIAAFAALIAGLVMVMRGDAALKGKRDRR